MADRWNNEALLAPKRTAIDEKLEPFFKDVESRLWTHWDRYCDCELGLHKAVVYNDISCEFKERSDSACKLLQYLSVDQQILLAIYAEEPIEEDGYLTIGIICHYGRLKWRGMIPRFFIWPDFAGFFVLMEKKTYVLAALHSLAKVPRIEEVYPATHVCALLDVWYEPMHMKLRIRVCLDEPDELASVVQERAVWIIGTLPPAHVPRRFRTTGELQAFFQPPLQPRCEPRVDYPALSWTLSVSRRQDIERAMAPFVERIESLLWARLPDGCRIERQDAFMACGTRSVAYQPYADSRDRIEITAENGASVTVRTWKTVSPGTRCEDAKARFRCPTFHPDFQCTELVPDDGGRTPFVAFVAQCEKLLHTLHALRGLRDVRKVTSEYLRISDAGTFLITEHYESAVSIFTFVVHAEISASDSAVCTVLYCEKYVFRETRKDKRPKTAPRRFEDVREFVAFIERQRRGEQSEYAKDKRS